MALGGRRGDQHGADLRARTGRTLGLLSVPARSTEQGEQSHILDRASTAQVTSSLSKEKKGYTTLTRRASHYDPRICRGCLHDVE